MRHRRYFLAVLLPTLLCLVASASKLCAQDESEGWSFRPITSPAIPHTEDASWSQAPVDRFVFAKLAENGLTPSASADRHSLVRRVTFNLTGLPPTPAQVDTFVGDEHPDAWPRLLDRLLASPHYGERWARHWLDVVRYADTTASDGNFVMRYAWRYRNYVIDTFNQDLPYDQFVTEQLAGDLLPQERAGGDLNLRRHIATGFLMLGPKSLAEADKEQVRMDMVDEQIDVTGRAFLAMTIACARCHDHKFDPIATDDYYSLAGIFRSMELLKGNAGITSMWHEGVVEYDSPRVQQQLERVETELAHQRAAAHDLESQPAAGQATWEQELLKETGQNDVTTNSLEEMSDLHAWYRADAVSPDDEGRVTRWLDNTASGLNLVSDAAAESTGTAPELSREIAWQSLCQMIICMNEFVYVR